MARLRSFLRALRRIVGAPDYEGYLEHHAACHGDGEPLDRKAYYEEFVTRRFGAGASRCC